VLLDDELDEPLLDDELDELLLDDELDELLLDDELDELLLDVELVAALELVALLDTELELAEEPVALLELPEELALDDDAALDDAELVEDPPMPALAEEPGPGPVPELDELENPLAPPEPTTTPLVSRQAPTSDADAKPRARARRMAP